MADSAMDTEQCVIKPGVACIKPEFLAPKEEDPEPADDSAAAAAASDADAVAAGDDKAAAAGALPAAAGALPAAAGVGAVAAWGKRFADELSGSGNEKKKRKGQNVNRPHLVKQPRRFKLCRFLWAMTEQEHLAALSGSSAASTNGAAPAPAPATALTVESETSAASANGSSLASDNGNSTTTAPGPGSSVVVGSSSDSPQLPVPSSHPLCPYSSCSFSHDIAYYLANKEPCSLEDKCHNYETFGLCEYGLTCKFGSSHIANGFNVKNEELWNKCKDVNYVSNSLPKDVQLQLRKRRFDFSRSDQAIKLAQANSSRTKKQQLAAATAAAAAVTDSTTADTAAGESSVNGASSSNSSSNGSAAAEQAARLGPAADDDLIRLRPAEKKKIVWRDQLYLAPLTTLGNLPFRRICRRLGADITCGEMAVATCLLQASPAEWALVKRHHTETVFGVQLCGSNAHAMIKCSELLAQVADMDFVDINVGCPIDLIYKQGAGSGLMRRQDALELMVRGMSSVLPCPLTVKMRTAIHLREKVAHTIIPHCREWGADLVTLHGRSREQRYTKHADWDYIRECAELARPLPFFGNGDVLDYEDYLAKKQQAGVDGIMIGRGALMKPWLFTEIKEQRHWDISSGERLDILREFAHNGLEHWGSDSEGVEKTRRFLLEWLSFLHRYIPLGLLERPPQSINQKPPAYIGRNQLETLMASKNSKDWVKISEMLLGPVSDTFEFLPKHKANSWG